MMRIKTVFKSLRGTLAQFMNMYLAMNGNKNRKSHYLAMTIKHIHSIEKGLAMQNVRFGFGLPRIKSIMIYLKKYVALTGNMDCLECSMAYSVIKKYIEFHDDAKFSNDEYESIRKEATRLFEPFEKKLNSEVGGVRLLNYEEISVDFEAFEKCVLSRHSVRDFTDTPVDKEKLIKAIELATHSPSACNRQSSRVYVLDRSDFSLIEGWTGGVKSFIGEVDKILIITSQMSAYEKDEFWQYTVSASIFAGYLSLSLHAVGLGACLLQRPLVSDSRWKRLSRDLNIPEDEQVICAMAVGNPAKIMKVPLSQRLEIERVLKFL